MAASTVPAQGPTYELGRVPSEEEIRAWDIDVNPEGKGLPPGSGTANEGAEIYAQKGCAICHGPTGAEVTDFILNTYPKGNPYPLVRKGKGPQSGHHIKSLGNYWPYATSIWDYINRAMPLIQSGIGMEDQLSANEVYALTAFILYQNGIIGENEVMNADSLPKVKMPNRDGFLPSEPVLRTNPDMKPDLHISPSSPLLKKTGSSQ